MLLNRICMRHIIILSLLLAGLGGCSANAPYRPFVPTTTTDHLGERWEQNQRAGKIGDKFCMEADLTKGEKRSSLCSVESVYDRKGKDVVPKYKLFIVEVDEQGRFYEDRQFQSLLDYLKQRQEVDAQRGCEGKGAKGLSLVTVVHGWRHSAAPNDSNLEDLRSILDLTYEFEKKGDHPLKCGAREVVGVYIGWRGTSSTMEGLLGKSILGDYDPIELLSFWDRKIAAQNVSMGSVRELLSVLQQFVRKRNDSLVTYEENETKKTKKERKNICSENYRENGWECKLDRMIIVGHSFGGLIVFNALSESLLNSITAGTLRSDENSDPPKVRLDTDLVVLVNPAIEGARFEPIYQAIRRRDLNYSMDKSMIKGKGFYKYQQPVLIAITAENDKATRIGFPIARSFTAMNQSKTPRSNGWLANELTDARDIEVEKFIEDNNQLYMDMSKEEHEVNNKTIGHVPRYRTHKLEFAGPTKKAKTDCDNWDDCRARMSARSYYSEATPGKNSCYFCETLKMVYVDQGLPYNSPVWIIHSEYKGLLDDHGGYDVQRHSIMPFLRQVYHQLVFNDDIFESKFIKNDQCKPTTTEPVSHPSTQD